LSQGGNENWEARQREARGPDLVLLDVGDGAVGEEGALIEGRHDHLPLFLREVRRPEQRGRGAARRPIAHRKATPTASPPPSLRSGSRKTCAGKDDHM